MAINLELPRKLQAVIVKTHQGAAEMMRPIGRIISAAPWCALSITACNLRGSSRLIAMIGLSVVNWMKT